MLHHDPAHLGVAQHAQQLLPLPVQPRADLGDHVEVHPALLPGKRLKALHLALQVILLVDGADPCVEQRATFRVGFLHQDGAGGELPGGNGELARLEPPPGGEVADPLLAGPVGELHGYGSCWQPAEGAYTLVACAGEEVIGMLNLQTFPNFPRRRHVAELVMAVRDDWQGKGVGTALMVAALDLADNWLNILRVELTVWVDNEPAIRLYKKFGFVVEGTATAFGYRDGKFVDAYQMARVRRPD